MAESGSSQTPAGGPPTEDLVAWARSRGRDGFTALYERISPAVWAWAAARIPPRLRGRLLPDDIVQEVWARAIDRFESFDPSRSSFRAWLFRIGQIVFLESLRALNRAGAGGGRPTSVAGAEEIPEEVTSIATRLARHEGLQAFLAQFVHLDPEERSLIIYRGLEGLPYEEVAERLGTSKEAVRKRWKRLQGRFDSSALPPELLESG